MITASLIIFSLLIEYVYDPISNMKDTYAINFLIEKYKNYFKDFFYNKYFIYLLFPVLIYIFINIITLFVDFIFHSFFSFLINLIILIYCLKPGEFNRMIEEIKLGASENISQFSKERVNYIMMNNSSEEILNSVFYASTRNIFSVLFWFLMLGSAGSLAYVSLDYMVNSKFKIDAQSKKKLRQLLGIIEFIPIHLTILSFALVDDFQTCKKNWQSLQSKNDIYSSNIEMMNTIGINLITNANKSESYEEKYSYVQMLIHRAFLAWLSIITLLILSGFFV